MAPQLTGSRTPHLCWPLDTRLRCLTTQIAAAQLARKYPGVRLHTHLAENQEDIDFSLKTYGCRPGEYLK